MKIRKALILPIIVSMLLGVVMVVPVGAPSTTIGVEPDSIVDLGLGPGSNFTVEIWVRSVADLAGVEFKLAYNTMVLTATSIAYGDVFGPTYFPLINEIHDADGYLHYGAMQAFGEPGVGDGRAAIITFSVDSLGESALNLYDTKIGDSASPPVPISHDALDGYFRNTLEIPTYTATFARRRAWPEHHDYYMTKDEDARNDLFAIVYNDGDFGAWVKIVFSVATITGVPVGDFEKDTIPLPAGAMIGETKDDRYYRTLTVGGWGADINTIIYGFKYYVTAKCLVDTDADGVPDTPTDIKTFSFEVFTTTE
jgi:hypothetical protein